MRHGVQERPSARRLFLVCMVASLAAVVVGGTLLHACWAATGFDAEAGRQFRYNGMLLIAVLGVGLVMHCPWGLRWARANGCVSSAESCTTDRGDK